MSQRHPCLRIYPIIFGFAIYNHGSFSLPRIHPFDPRNHTVQVVHDIQALNGPEIYLSVFPLLISF